MAGSGSTIAQEVAVGRRYAPAIAWPTIRLAIGIWAAFGASSGAALSGVLPYWASGVLNTAILYGAYTVVHEAVHHNIVPRDARLRWLNAALGQAICPLLFLNYQTHQRAHVVHHTQCNSEQDPDIYARGRFGAVAFWRIPLAALNQLNPLALARDCARYALAPRQRLAAYASYAAYCAVTLGIVAAGYGPALLVLWFLPWLVGYSVMLVFFTWVPHHPHMETGRYRNTRCSLWPGANLLVQGQHMHLIHHLLPWVPYYHCEAVFREVRPYLERHGAAIDGFWPRESAAR